MRYDSKSTLRKRMSGVISLLLSQKTCTRLSVGHRRRPGGGGAMPTSQLICVSAPSTPVQAAELAASVSLQVHRPSMKSCGVHVLPSWRAHSKQLSMLNMAQVLVWPSTSMVNRSASVRPG